MIRAREQVEGNQPLHRDNAIYAPKVKGKSKKHSSLRGGETISCESVVQPFPGHSYGTAAFLFIIYLSSSMLMPELSLLVVDWCSRGAGSSSKGPISEASKTGSASMVSNLVLKSLAPLACEEEFERRRALFMCRPAMSWASSPGWPL